MEAELRAYRSDPTDARFADVYRVARPWLRSVGIATVRRYSNLTVSGSLDDVVVEGALAISNATRRFVYLCGGCGRAFVHLSSLTTHQRERHRRRGNGELVSLSKFVRTSARLAMKRTARRIVRPEVLDPDVEPVVDGEAEARIVFEVLVAGVRERLSAWAVVNLENLLRRDLQAGGEVAAIRYEALRREVRDILHSG
jgi:hypothetical protein